MRSSIVPAAAFLPGVGITHSAAGFGCRHDGRRTGASAKPTILERELPSGRLIRSIAILPAQ